MAHLLGFDAADIDRLEREQFDHYLGLERRRMDQSDDWTTCRDGLARSIASALGVTPTTDALADFEVTIDRCHEEADAFDRWGSFVELLWKRRRDASRGNAANSARPS